MAVSTVSDMAAKQRDATAEHSRRRVWLRRLGPFVPIAALAIIAALTVDGFGTTPNLIAVVQASAITGIAAIGTAAITISGKFVSLAIEQQAVTAAYVFAATVSAGQPVLLALVLAFAVAIILGLVQGYLVSRGLNPIVTTLAFGSALFGSVVMLADNRTITLSPNPIAWLGGGTTFGIPNQAIIFVVLLVLGSLFLSRTKLGRQMVLTGANPKAANLIGVPTRRIVMIAFVAAALTAALVGILVVGQVSQAKSDMFRGLTIDVVAAILVGGIAIQGGEGQLWRAGFGAIVLTMLGNIMLLLGIDAGVRDLLKGLLAAGVLLSMRLLKARGS
ncbi:ABC transporter permease [Mesorhizobium helmanticense]|uniref:ABC transporter permease n=1 Tax=Mesorhizobium helmanticense TaxID=1776423 RepID=A0A2T4IZK2_9HYPH|nr:ABC transporter permease [Mesorhizobium helmanticense]PTE11013.1 ABC transporter permease [Mesorhizobium helmanticense]